MKLADKRDRGEGGGVAHFFGGFPIAGVLHGAMEREDIAAVQAAMADLQQDWAAALQEPQAENAETARQAQNAERVTVRAEQDAEYEALVVADLMRAPPPPPPPAPGGLPMKVRFPDGTEEVYPFAPTACLCEVIQLAQARMGKSAPMTVHACGATLDANRSLAQCGLTTPHVLRVDWLIIS